MSSPLGLVAMCQGVLGQSRCGTEQWDSLWVMDGLRGATSAPQRPAQGPFHHSAQLLEGDVLPLGLVAMCQGIFGQSLCGTEQWDSLWVVDGLRGATSAPQRPAQGPFHISAQLLEGDVLPLGLVAACQGIFGQS